jgi:hypothetical protein
MCPPFITPDEPKRDHHIEQLSVTASILCRGNVLTEPLSSQGLFSVYSLSCKRVLIPWQPKRCDEYVPSEPCVSQTLPSNGCLFWLYYSGFQPSCHNICIISSLFLIYGFSCSHAWILTRPLSVTITTFSPLCLPEHRPRLVVTGSPNTVHASCSPACRHSFLENKTAPSFKVMLTDKEWTLAVIMNKQETLSDYGVTCK